MQRTFTIRTIYLDNAQERVATLARKAKKLDIALPTLEIGEEKLVKRCPEFHSIQEPWFKSYTTVTLNWVDIQLNGWNFAGTIEKIEGYNMVNAVPEFAPKLPKDLRTAKIACEHCNTARNRKKHMVLVSNDGITKIVGSTCIKDFLGHDAESKIAALEFERTIFADLEDEYSEYGSDSNRVFEASLKAVLTILFATVRLNGWLKKSEEDLMLGKVPTYSWVKDQLWAKLKPEQYYPLLDADREKADIVLQRWEAIKLDPDKNDEWEYKKALIVKRGCVEPQKLALVVGLAYGDYLSYMRENEKSVKGEISDHFGTVSKRDIYNLTITKVLPISSDWGVSNMVIGVLEGTSNQFVWFDSKARDSYQPGETLQAKATIKEHSNDKKYGKQTKLTRVAFL